MAPRIDRLFDHTVRIWRATVIKDAIGGETRVYGLVATAGCALNRSVAPVADTGPGMTPTGRRRFYLRPDADVLARDVVEIVTGPDGPGYWEVDEPPTRPRGHHTQVDAIAWAGIPPEVPAS